MHNGNEVDGTTGALSVPIYQASTFHQEDIDHFGAYDYSRSGNPTRHALEDTMAQLEGGCAAFAFSSGMAAITAVLSLLKAGDHVIASRDIYGGTYRGLTGHFSKYNIETDFVDTADVNNISRALKPNTAMLILETPSNPLMKITDIRAAAAQVKERGIITVVDNTFMTPYLQRPLELGADVVVHSATKFLGGHSDLVAGIAVVKDKTLAKEIYYVQNTLGAVLAPHDSWLLLRGIKTLKVRMDKEQVTAQALAAWLSEHPHIDRVYYPGLEGRQGYDIQREQAYGPGAVLSFETNDLETAKRIMKKVNLFAVAVSLGSVESILSYPAKMSHASIPPRERARLGITDRLIRISAGLEEPEDLIRDLEQAMEE